MMKRADFADPDGDQRQIQQEAIKMANALCLR